MKLKVTIRFPDGKEITEDDVEDAHVNMEGDGVTYAYVTMKKWYPSAKRWEYPQIYKKPQLVIVKSM